MNLVAGACSLIISVFSGHKLHKKNEVDKNAPQNKKVQKQSKIIQGYFCHINSVFLIINSFCTVFFLVQFF